jgi:HlyD family secretion protein
VALVLPGCNDQAPAGWSGYAEGDYVYVAAPVGGTLETLSVRRGQSVKAGALLFKLEDTSQRAARAEAQAREAAAVAQAADTTKGKRAEEIAVIRAQLAQARAAAQLAEAELRRQQQLVAQQFVSRSRLDDAMTAATEARARVRELEASLRVATLPSRSDTQAAARANVDAAAQASVQLTWLEQQTVQAAPADALVADTFFNPGEYVPPGQPVVALLPPDQRKARFFVPESELGTLAIGQPVTVRCDGCGAPIAARITYIAPQAEYTPPVIYSNTQRAKLVFMVEAAPDPADAVRLHPGQPLDVQRAADVARAAS